MSTMCLTTGLIFLIWRHCTTFINVKQFNNIHHSLFHDSMVYRVLYQTPITLFHKYLGYWSKNSVPSCCQISFWRFHLIVVNGLVHLAHRCRQVQSRSNGFSRFCWRGFWRQGGIIKRWRCCRWTIIEWRLQNKYKQMNHEDYQHIGTVWYSSVGQGYGDYFLQ